MWWIFIQIPQSEGPFSVYESSRTKAGYRVETKNDVGIGACIGIRLRNCSQHQLICVWWRNSSSSQMQTCSNLCKQFCTEEPPTLSSSSSSQAPTWQTVYVTDWQSKTKELSSTYTNTRTFLPTSCSSPKCRGGERGRVLLICIVVVVVVLFQLNPLAINTMFKIIR